MPARKAKKVFNPETTVIHVEISSPYEAEGFWLKGQLIASWYMNDAVWRSEYMDPLIEGPGFQRERVGEKDPRYPALKAELLASLGCDDDGDVDSEESED